MLTLNEPLLKTVQSKYSLEGLLRFTTPLWECLQGSTEFPVQWEFNNMFLSIRDVTVSKKLISHWPNLSH